MMKNFKDIKVAVAGTGYVGLSIATLLSQHHHVPSVDVIPEKVDRLSAHRKRNRKLKNLEKNMSNQTSDNNKRIAKNTIFLIYE